MTSCNFNISYINPYPYSHTMSAKIPSAASLSRIVLRRIPAVFSKTVLTIFRQFNFFLFDISLTPSPGFSLTPVYFSPLNVQLAQTIHSIVRLSTLSTLIHQNYVESCPPRKMPISRHFAVIHQVIHIIHRFFPPHRWILPSLYICFIFVNIL